MTLPIDNIDYLFADRCACGAPRDDSVFCANCRTHHEAIPCLLPAEATIEIEPEGYVLLVGNEAVACCTTIEAIRQAAEERGLAVAPPPCAGQWCVREAGASGFCDRCTPLLAPCEQVVYTHCPCGAPVEIDGLCGACYAEQAPKHWPQVPAITTDLLSNGNLHIKINGLTLYCGSVETARALYAALGAIFLTVEEQRDVDALAAHVATFFAKEKWQVAA